MLYISIALSILHTILQRTDAYSIGDVDPRALRGVWRLTSLDVHKQGFFPPQSASPDPKLPMKEFTTYPPKKKKSELDSTIDFLTPMPKKETEIFIKLKDDNTFEQCKALYFSDGTDEENSLEENLEMEVSKRERESFAWKGTWDFIDGKLILAADRPEKKPFSVYDDNGDVDGKDSSAEADTILVGKVAVQSEESLTENPVVEQRQMMSDQDALQEGEQANISSSQPNKGTIDVHLSVPKGKIKTGKFMYPKNHPSFFEQPIYHPEAKGHFELRQILGEYNAKLADDEDDDLTELFRKKDLVGKRFYLSTFPLPKRKKKFERWDKVENRYVQDEYEPTAEEKKEEELKPGNDMQVMAVELFANNTFSTLQGLGSSTVLRGRWSIIGKKRDELWMLVSRFGFGRSVSGSTFSEGTSLTQNDEKGYWGTITEAVDCGNDSIEDNPSQWRNEKMEINGAVMIGWGLEPCSVGRFKMIEIEDTLEDEEEEEEEDEYEEMSTDDVMENANSLDSLLGTADSDIEDSSGSFDLPGTFE